MVVNAEAPKSAVKIKWKTWVNMDCSVCAVATMWKKGRQRVKGYYKFDDTAAWKDGGPTKWEKRHRAEQFQEGKVR